MSEEPEEFGDPQKVLVRALELREKRRNAYKALEKARDDHWNQNTAVTGAWVTIMKQESCDCDEEYRQFLIAVKASNLDEIIDRANLAASQGALS